MEYQIPRVEKSLNRFSRIVVITGLGWLKIGFKDKITRGRLRGV